MTKPRISSPWLWPLAILALLLVSACNKSFHDIGTPPQFTDVGETVPIEQILVADEPKIISGPQRLEMTDNSIWNKNDAIYFRDTRAYEVGDILTVRISMNDSARFNNVSGRESSLTGNATTGGNVTVPIFGELPNTTIEGSVGVGLETERGGTINRTEKIQLQVAAAVVAASPNGNLHIIGSQEVRVNHEIRVLTVQGVVRSRDILPDNTIPYEKIAEARISYGGHNDRFVPEKRRRWNPFGKPLAYASE